MKKSILSLVLVAAAGTAQFANAANVSANGYMYESACRQAAAPEAKESTTARAARDVAQRVGDAPAGTTYGILSTDRDGNLTVNTPLGRYTVERRADGSYSLLGITARLVSAHKGVYTVKSSLGTWRIDTRRCTVTKL